jgi:ABC-type multidrug transport system fused ATPase/permease subunit
MNCVVINVALQSIYAGSTTLAIQKTVEPNLSLAFPFGSSGSALAQLYYAADASSAPVEQFYCQADSCTQTNTTAETTYSCADLKCTCRPGTAFCGGAAGGIDLSTTIDSMQGPLDIACSSADASSCSFKQSLLVKLFGEEGLGLSGCSQGECVREDVRLALAPNNVGSDSGSALAPGVIAGLAVIGGLVALLLGLVVLGFWRQRKAAKSHSSLQHGPKQVGVSWQNVSYALPGANFASLRRAGPAGKNVLDGLSAGVPCGALVAILGPSGAGKR